MNNTETQNRPLVVDIDGTFLKTDLLFEGFWLGLSVKPLATLRIVLGNLNNKAKLKKELSELTDLKVDLLPVNENVSEMIKTAIREDREVLFASASDASLVDALAESHGIKGDHIASDGVSNLSGKTKTAALVERFGAGNYAYAGDAKVDIPVWESAGEAILVGSHKGTSKSLKAAGIEVTAIENDFSWKKLIKQLRPHQWVKNALLFLPLIAAHRTDALGFFTVFLGAIAYCAAASSIYIVNDLLDLEADRQHPTKRNRPLAAGDIKISIAMFVSVILGMLALSIGAFLGSAFFAVVVVYITTSLVYSLKLKRLRWIDVYTLATLYTLRVIAGALAAQVVASGWLIAFIFPAFVALGCTKRLTELTLAKAKGKVPGRGYSTEDRLGLLNLAAAGLIAAIAVVIIYTFGDTAIGLYQDIWLLRLAIIPVAFWLIRMVLLGWQGQQDYDPLVFAMRDSTGIAIIAITIGILFYAAGIV